jgi:hypothetical protein
MKHKPRLKLPSKMTRQRIWAFWGVILSQSSLEWRGQWAMPNLTGLRSTARYQRNKISSYLANNSVTPTIPASKANPDSVHLIQLRIDNFY